MSITNKPESPVCKYCRGPVDTSVAGVVACGNCWLEYPAEQQTLPRLGRIVRDGKSRGVAIRGDGLFDCLGSMSQAFDLLGEDFRTERNALTRGDEA